MSAPEPPADLTKKVVRGAGLAGLGHALTQVMSLASLLVLARLLTPAEIGEFAAGSIVVGAGVLLSESGMLAAVIHSDEVEEAANTAFLATVAGGLLMSAAALAVSPLVGLFFHSRTIGLVAASLSGWIAVRQTMVVPDALMQRRFSFLRRVVVEPCNAFVSGAVVIACAVFGLGVWSLVVSTYAGITVQAILAWVLARWRPRLRQASLARWRTMARYGRPIVVGEAIRMAQAESITAIIGRMLGTASLGQYNYALRVARQPLMVLVNAVAYVLMPALSRISHDETRVRNAAIRSLGWAASIALPLSAFVLVLGPSLVVALFGERWAPAGSATRAMFAVSVGGAVVIVASESWKATGNPHWLPRIHGLAALLSVALTVAVAGVGLTAVGAVVSVAAAGSGAYALYGLAAALQARFSDLAAVFVRPFAASGLMAALLFVVVARTHANDHGPAAALAIIGAEVLVGTAAYLGFLAAFAPSEARALVLSLRRTRFGRYGTPTDA